MADEVPVETLSFRQKVKKFLAELWERNGQRMTMWIVTVLAAAVYNCANGPSDDGDIPPPTPPPFDWPENPFGWIAPEEEGRENHLLLFSETEAGFLTVVRDGDNIPAWRLFTKATGHDFGPYQQGSIGSCVAFGSAAAVEFGLAANIALTRGPPQKWDAISREAIYGGGRINIRRADVPPEGMMGEWAAQWLDRFGAVGISQGTPPVGPYTVARCRLWGDRGVPQAVVDLGKNNTVKTALVRTPEEVQQALANGYFVFICSSVGFGNLNGPPLQRDKDGFLYASGSWPHCMCVAGYRGDKKGFLIVNSWGGGWVTGPKGFGDEPEGSFWCTWDTMKRIVGGSRGEQPDSYAVSSIGGFRRRLIEPQDWFILDWKEKVEFVPAGRFGWIGNPRQ